ncbi:NosD domain-containing protein [Halobellus inordinatus]|uniref:NosD domain-containing protein n=1 Tax=Halobellus inordinatus TaxID=1126236 RepID=UPI00210EEB91|nr:NosD domain-containing protein [Halobellus inordinatus]
MRRDAALAAAVLILVTAYGGAFVADATHDPEPVSFGTTASSGLTAETVRETQAAGAVVPKAQVSYAQFETVVGYYGIGSLVAALGREGHTQRFGPPLGVFVSDFAGTSPTVSDAGYPVPTAGRPGWTTAADAHYVIVPERSASAGQSRGRAIVPFSDAAGARQFADRVGSDATVWSWATVRDRIDGPSRTRSWPETVESRDQAANRTATEVRSLADRPVSQVVGEDAPSIQRAVDAAPPNTTVYVPPGTYGERVRIDHPITLRGAGPETVVSAGSNGTGVTVTSDRVAVVGLAVTEVGTETIDVGNGSEAWDTHVKQTYGRGDAGVAFVNTSGALVADVTVRTPSNGVLLRQTNKTLVEDVTVHGTATDGAGYMGVMAMEATSAVVQHSTFSGTLDGVYSHRSNGLVVRDSRMRDVRFGTHLMFTSETLLAENVARDTDTGLVVMTRPSGNALVGNDVRDSGRGIVTAGSDSYVARNRLVGNEVGLEIGTRRSLYEHNVLLRNGVGADATGIVASNRVLANDFVDNDRPADATGGATRVWSSAGGGNYWARAAGGPVDAVDRPYRPTSAVDARYGAPGTRLLSESPGLLALRELRGTVPGMRSGGIVDQRPAATPVNPDLLAVARNDSQRMMNDSLVTTNFDR